jgi:hypothetical protein
MERMYRVAISNPSSTCYNCGDAGIPAGTDFCASCQTVYASETDVRSDYADITVGYFETMEESEERKGELIPSHY